MKNGLWTSRRWLARLSFSFFIIALWLLWHGYQGARQHTISSGRATLCYVAAFMALSLFLMGVRERHREEEN
jgi:type VI protein secretion system component VasK